MTDHTVLLPSRMLYRESVSEDTVQFSSGGQIKGKQAYLGSRHVAGWRRNGTRHGTALMGRLARGQEKQVTLSQWIDISHGMMRQGQYYNSINSSHSPGHFFQNRTFVYLRLCTCGHELRHVCPD